MFVWYVRIPYMHSALFVRMQYFHMFIHVERCQDIAIKQATFKSQKKLYVRLTYGIRRKKERKGKV